MTSPKPPDPSGKKKATDDKATKAADSADDSGRDVVLLHSRTEDGQGVRAIRKRPNAESLEVAEIRPLKPGKPLQGTELVSLRPREEAPFLCDVEVQYDGRTDEARRGAGPAQVASGRYRKNWDKVFGKRRTTPTKKRRPPSSSQGCN